MTPYRWHLLPELPPEKAYVIVQLTDWQQGFGRLNAHKQWELSGIVHTGAEVYAWTETPPPCPM